MSTIKELAISVVAETSKFEKGMMNASSVLKSTQVNMGELAGKAIDATAALSGLAAAGLTYLTVESTKAIAEQTRLADRIGVSTEIMAGFRLAAGEMGVSQETADKSLEHFSKTMGEAINGSEEAQKAFKKIGLDFKELAGMLPDEQLQVVANAFADIPDKASQAAAAQAIFGKSGVELVDVLAQGAQGLQDATDKAIDYGTALTRVDSEKILEAQQAIDELKVQFQGAIDQLTLQFAPIIQETAHMISDWAKEAGGAGNIAVNAFHTVIATIAELSDYLEIAIAAWQGLRGVFDIVGLAGMSVLSSIAEGLQKVGKWVGIDTSAFTEFAHTMRDAFQADLDEAIQGSADAWDKFTSGANANKVDAFFSNLQTKAERAAQAATKGFDEKKLAAAKAAADKAKENDAEMLKAQKEAQKKLDEMQKKADELTKTLRTPGEVLADGIKEAMEYLNQGMITEETFNRDLLKLKQDFAKANKDESGGSGQFKEFNTHLINVAALGGTKKGAAQEVKSSQLEEANKLSLSILQELKKQNGGTVGK